MNRDTITPVRMHLLVCSVVFALVAVPRAQQPVFRAETDVVPIYATVTGSGGRAVTNLTADDFVVQVDGSEMPIASFSNEPQPFAGVLLMDYSGSMSRHREAVHDAAEQFIYRLLPADRVRMGGFSNRIVLAPDDFTGEPPRLIDALRTRVGRLGGGASPVWASVNASLEALGTQPLRRVLILLSDGHDAIARGQPRVSVDAVFRRVRDDNVLVYAMGFVNRRAGRSAYEPVIVNGPNRQVEELANKSGGDYFEVDRSPDFNRMFTSIVDELHSQYLLGIRVDARDGRRHRLQVHVRQPGLKVRAPEGFTARRPAAGDVAP